MPGGHSHRRSAAVNQVAQYKAVAPPPSTPKASRRPLSRGWRWRSQDTAVPEAKATTRSSLASRRGFEVRLQPLQTRLTRNGNVKADAPTLFTGGEAFVGAVGPDAPVLPQLAAARQIQALERLHTSAAAPRAAAPRGQRLQPLEVYGSSRGAIAGEPRSPRRRASAGSSGSAGSSADDPRRLWARLFEVC